MIIPAYTRLSTDETKQANSLAVQAQVLNTWAAVNNVTLDPELFFEDKESAIKVWFLDRPAAKAMLAWMRINRCDLFVATKTDRVFRDTEDGLRTLRILTDEGIRFRLLELPDMDFSTAAGKFIFTQMLAAARFEPDRRAERNAETTTYLRDQGKAISRDPFGWNSDDDGFLLPNKDEQATLQRIIHLTSDGLGARRIAAMFNRTQTPTKTGAQWHDSTVRGLIERGRIHDPLTGASVPLATILNP
jgi:DNA invertase Pin-like site-specific DNA recombinase